MTRDGMSEPGAVAAVDLGATSGRVVLGRVGPGTLSIEEVARFPNGAVQTDSGLHWDLDALFTGVRGGLGAAFRVEPAIASIGIDAWAVDYGLLRGDELLGQPFHYRDERTRAGVRAVHELVPFAELYARNGLQFLPFNTLYQLAVESRARLEAADTMLLIPDLVAFLLTGARVAERTNASTTGLLDVASREWDGELVEQLGIPARLLPPLVSPGARIGGLRPELAAELGTVRSVDVVAVGSHDTASAVVGVPMHPASAAYISCGTWGLVGVELDRPVLTDAAREANFTNEGGVDGRVRFLHNVMGLWLLSESIREWERRGERMTLGELLAGATTLTPPPVFDVEDPRFLTPGDLPSRIADWYREHGLPVPRRPVDVVRAIIESLAEGFARTVHRAAELSGVDVRVIHLVGGGARNELLCSLTAARSGLPVLAGPVEATAIGNVLVQARAECLVDGELASLRSLVEHAFPPRRYEPEASPAR